MSGVAFPDTLDFTTKKNAVKSTFLQQVLTPLTGTTVNPTETPIISVPCGRYGFYLDPNNLYLNFTLTNTDTTAATSFILDGSAYALFDRITVSSSGNPLTDVQYFSPLATAMLELQTGVSKSTGLSCSFGTAPEATNNVNRAGATINKAASMNISIPLMFSAIDATCQSKLIPVGAISDLQVQFYMSSVANSVQSSSSTANWQITNFSLVADFIELEASAQKELDSANGGMYRFSGEVWRSYQFNINSGSTSDTIVVPVKCQSAKTLLSIYRPAANIGNVASVANLSRLNPFVTGATWYANVGAVTMPQIPLKNSSQFYIEMIKGLHGLYNPLAYMSQINYTNWNNNDYTAGDAAGSVGSFVALLDLESFSNKNNVIYSGVPIAGGTTLSISQTYGGSGNGAITANVTQNVYVHADAMITVENGVMSLIF